MILTTDVKLNLGLSVLRKRPDGYHDIETLFIHCRDYSDTLEVIAGDDYSRTSASLFARYGEEGTVQGISPDGKLMVTIAGDGGVDWDPLEDLCAKAYAILDKDFGLPPAKIFLEKKVPVGAGLGGGSADAAFTLKALDGLFSLGLDDETYEVKVVVPEGISVSTREAYGGIIPREKMEKDAPAPLREALRKPVRLWKDFLVNDFESSVFKAHPELEAIKRSLYDSGAVYASMSGSGSALFALYERA